MVTPSSSSPGKQLARRPMIILAVLVTVFYVPIWIHLSTTTNTSASAHEVLLEGVAGGGGIPSLDALIAARSSLEVGGGSTNIRTGGDSGTPGGGGKSLEELETRIHYLETKLNAYLAYTSDPFLSNQDSTKCQNMVYIKSIACKDVPTCALDNQSICLDNFPNAQKNTKKEKKVPCVVYDYGIRESPEYGLAFANDPFQCNVFGFDPSPISIQWWKDNKKTIKEKYPTYNFQSIGAGGHDGLLTLREYDWGQVSILEFPQRVVDTTKCDTRGACKYKFHQQQGSFSIPVKTLKTVMNEHGHDRIHLLKLDVEGSEYVFLETMIDDLSCRKVDQLTLEWHHYDYDRRYGVTSNPQINTIVALLKDRCGLEQYWHHGSKGWPSNQKIYQEMGMNLYYTLSSFKRTTVYSD